MLRPPHGSSVALISWRRSAAAVLIALQAVIAVSPVLERRDEVRRDTHAEEQGSRHLLAHDESTCGVCAVRTVASDALPQAAVPVAIVARDMVNVTHPTGALPAGLAPDNHSRAPPVPG